MNRSRIRSNKFCWQFRIRFGQVSSNKEIFYWLDLICMSKLTCSMERFFLVFPVVTTSLFILMAAETLNDLWIGVRKNHSWTKNKKEQLMVKPIVPIYNIILHNKSMNLVQTGSNDFLFVLIIFAADVVSLYLSTNFAADLFIVSLWFSYLGL